MEEAGPVTEMSFFVPLTGRASISTGDEMLALGLELGRKFEQEAFLYGDTRWVYEVDCATNEFVVRAATSQMTLQQLGDIYSRIRHRDFRFGTPGQPQSIPEYRVIGYRVPTGFVSALGMASDGLWPESEIIK